MNSEFKKDNIFIRAIKKEDANKLFELLNNINDETKEFFHPHSFDLQTIKSICSSKKDHYFCMFLDNKLIGYSFLRLFDFEIPSFGIIIKKEFSGKGYGKFLTKWTIERAKSLGYKKVILKTYKKNLSAQKIYDNLGFKIIGETEDKRQLKMELNLA